MLDSLRTSAPLRLIRSHRRITAAALIGIAALLALDAIPTRVIEAPRPMIPSPGSDEVIVPITLADPAATAEVQPGDTITVVLTDDSGYGQEVARSARVRSIGSGTGLGATRSGALSVIVPRTDGLRLASAPARGVLSIVIQPDH